jgi:hypothetical protein
MSFFMRFGPPFIANRGAPINYHYVPYKCGIFTYMVSTSLCRVVQVPIVGLKNHHYIRPYLFSFIREECTYA